MSNSEPKRTLGISCARSGLDEKGYAPMLGLWTLRNRKPVPATSMREWGRWRAKEANRRVAVTAFKQPEHDSVTVSTLFLGIGDHDVILGPPLLFESKVFGGPLHGETWRYSTWEEAEKGHRELTERAIMAGEMAALELRKRLKKLSKRA